MVEKDFTFTAIPAAYRRRVFALFGAPRPAKRSRSAGEALISSI